MTTIAKKACRERRGRILARVEAWLTLHVKGPIARWLFRKIRDRAQVAGMVAKNSLVLGFNSAILFDGRPGELHHPNPLVSYAVGHWPIERRRRRLLIFAEAVTLAHVARAVTLAHSLDSSRYEVHLVCDPRYLSLFRELDFPVHPIHSINSEVFQGRLAQGRPLYTPTELRQYVQEDLRIMTDWKPDLVIGDFRLSLSVSARLSCVPYAAMTNAYWSPYARPRFLVPELAITERFGLRVAQGIFDLIRPFVFAQHAYGLNKVRREYGLPAVGYNLNHMFSDADYTLYPDLPNVVPTINPPPHHRYIGPVVWSFGKLPSWWSSLRDNVPTAYVTMGTSGRDDVARTVAHSLAHMGWQVLMATADRGRVTGTRESVWIANYLPGMAAARRGDLVVCNGGSGAVYQALAAGTPVLGIPMNLDQYLMMDYIRRSEAGDYIRAGMVTTESVTHVVRRMAESPQYKTRAVQLRDQIFHYRTSERIQACVADILHDGTGVPSCQYPIVAAC